MASADTEGDGPIFGSRHYDWTSTLQEAAPASDAFGGPPVPDQPIPVTALRPAQGSHTRGFVPDLGGILVQSL